MDTKHITHIYLSSFVWQNNKQVFCQYHISRLIIIYLRRYLRTSFDRPYKTVHARASRSTRQNANARLASRRDHHQRARHMRSRGHQEVPLQRRRSTTRTPQTEHGVVHRNHRKSAQQHGDVEAELDLRPNLIWEKTFSRDGPKNENFNLN